MNEPKSTFLKVDYARLTAVLVEGVKELDVQQQSLREESLQAQQRVSALEQRNAELERQNRDLQQRMEELEYQMRSLPDMVRDLLQRR